MSIFISLNETDSLKIILGNFFEKAGVKRRLKFICENKIIGCEKWIQFELYRFLCEFDDVDQESILVEEYFDSDQRNHKSRSCQYIDLTFRLKHKQYFIPLELKQKNFLALNDVNNDICKNRCIIPSQKVYFRKVYCALFHPKIENNIILERLEKSKYNNINYEYSINIPATEHLCSIFSNDII